MRTSYSALETFNQCPQKYKFQYIDKIKALKTKETAFGTLIHETLKFMFSHDPLFPTLDEVVAHFRGQWQAQEKLQLTDEERSIYLQQGEKMLRRFYAKNPPWNFNVVDLESHFEVAVEDPLTKEVHVLAGIMDRIDKTDDETYEIIDYKTNRRIAPQATIDVNLQLSLYHLGLTKRWPHVQPENIRLSLLYVKHGEKLTTKRDTASAGRVKDSLLGTIREIQARERSADFPPIPSGLCNHCPYQPICPAWRHLYKNKKPKINDQHEADAIIKEYLDLKKEEQKNKQRLAELQSQLKEYMDREGLTRVFGDSGVIAKKLQERFAYDFEKIHTLFAKEGLGTSWYAILTPDEKKLKALLITLPPHVREAVETARKKVKEFVVLSASAKKFSDSDGATDSMRNM